MRAKTLILVVEDDEAIRESVKEILEMEDFRVNTAIHGEDAINQLRAMSEVPNLILLDLNMPVMTGKEFIEALKKEEPKLASIPIVVMTATPVTNLFGISGMLKKPVELDAILDKIREVTAPV